MRRIWIGIGSIAAVVAVSGVTVQVLGLLAREEVVETATFDAAGVETLDIRSPNGSIEVTGDDVDEITVVAEITHGLRRTGNRVELEGSTLVAHSSCRWYSNWCRVRYRVVVPRDMVVLADSDNGRVTVIDIDADVVADSDNGTIELLRLAGTVRADTSNGSVTARGLRSAIVEADSDNGEVVLEFAEAPTTVVATSDNGRVEVVVPDGPETYRTELDTDNGSVDNGVRSDPTSDRSITVESNNGSVSIRYPTG